MTTTRFERSLDAGHTVRPMPIDRYDRIAGTILGTAVGDSLGLPRERLTRARARRLFGDRIEHALVLGRGMVSDDTEHTCLVAQSLLAAPGDPREFAHVFARKLKWWFAALPAAVGAATARACINLWFGWSPERSGVWSAGDGPAMRAAILGVVLGEDPRRLREWVRASSRITHVDARAERAAFLVAFAAAYASTRRPKEIVAQRFLATALAAVGDADDELRRIVELMSAHLARGAQPEVFAAALSVGRGVTGFAYHAVPVALYAWLRRPADLRGVVTDTIHCGGDTDTTAAIAGALAGAANGLGAIPRGWVEGVAEWPRSVTWMKGLAARLAKRFPTVGAPDVRVGEAPLAWAFVPVRNVVFLAVLLGHVVRRALPPYGVGR
jgi:ADP-ribosylglycohydrolase